MFQGERALQHAMAYSDSKSDLIGQVGFPSCERARRRLCKVVSRPSASNAARCQPAWRDRVSRVRGSNSHPVGAQPPLIVDEHAAIATGAAPKQFDLTCSPATCSATHPQSEKRHAQPAASTHAGRQRRR